MIYIKDVLLLWFVSFWIKNILAVVLKIRSNKTKNWVRNYINQLLKNLKKAFYYILQYSWGADLAEWSIISKFNERIRFSLCVIDIVSKYA